ncbi:MAG: ABC transporter permease [Tissierellia bacterium]|nr:ABC transporter permease [Tissierellia bacterium]
MNVFNKIIYDAIQGSAPILLCVLGGIFAYKANVLNIALEGMMLIGAFFACLITFMTGNYMLALAIAVLASIIFSVIFSYFGITLKGNVIIIGLAINLLASALTAFFLKIMEKSELVAANYVVADHRIAIPGIGDIPILGSILSNHTLLTWFSYILIAIMAIFMYKTSLGLHIRVVGENEDAAISLGLKTSKLKYIAIIVGGITCGLAGTSLAMDELGGIFTPGMTTGRGFIAIAAIYCGQGSPQASALYAILFGLARSLALNLGIYAGSSSRIFNALPYFAICLILMISSIVKHRHSNKRGY